MPLSDERLAQIRQHVGNMAHWVYWSDQEEVAELLAAYDEQHAEAVAMSRLAAFEQGRNTRLRAEVERLTEKVMNIDAWVEHVAPKYESEWEDPGYLIPLLYNERDEALDRAEKVEAEVERLRAQVAAVEAEVDTWLDLDHSTELGKAIYYDNAEKTIDLAEERIRAALASADGVQNAG